VSFWGKIHGHERDYLIIRALVLGGSKIVKQFYFSDDGGLTFAQLPDISRDEVVQRKAFVYHGAFTGNASTLLADYQPPKAPTGEEEEAPAEEAGQETPGKDRQITELERLSYVVSVIEKDTSVVPRGAYLRTASNDVLPDPAFKGVSTVLYTCQTAF
jgi:hypothetical protein